MKKINTLGDLSNVQVNKLSQRPHMETIEKGEILKQLSKKVNEEDILKLYYCESLDEYYIGKRCGNFYYAKVEIYSDGDICLHYKWSRYLPWGKHIVDETTKWKEFTYPSEPKEISFEKWLKGFIQSIESN